MNIKELTKHDVTSELINYNGDLYQLIAEECDSAVIYYSDSGDIYNSATSEEVDYASGMMEETDFNFKNMDDTITVCAYWIMENRLGLKYKAELEEDLETLQDRVDTLNADIICKLNVCPDLLEQAQEEETELLEIIEMISEVI